jgi:C4-dicarboxylate-specific signal transduction histidine kinase
MKRLHYLPLFIIILGILLIGASAFSWLHTYTEQVDANDLAMLQIAESSLIFSLSACLLLVIIAQIILDRQRERLQKQLEQAQATIQQRLAKEADHRQFAMLGVLSGSLAHELGQPLSSARVGLEGLHYLRQIGREPSAEHLQLTLSRVGMSLLAMTQTIEHLRCLAGTTSQQRREIGDLVAQVDYVLRDREQWLRYSDIAIQFDKPDREITALIDTAGLRLVLTNLLRNAAEAVIAQTPNRRLIRITVGPGTTIAIHDSGDGIPAAIQNSLFEPFTSTKGDGVRGIGLPLAKVSVERMGGKITVDSLPGSGTTFTIHLLGPHDTTTLPIPELS